jgi:hypothetical protein
VGPNHPTALLRDAKQQFKSIGHFGLRIYLEACATGRIVNNVAINNGSLRANDYFGLGTLARRANASKVSRIHLPVPIDHLETHLADSQTILKISFQFMVSEIHHAAFKQGASYNYGMCDPPIWSFGPAVRRAPGHSWDRPSALGPEMAESSLGWSPPEVAIDAGRLAENDRSGHCRGTERRQAQGSNETADKVAIGRGEQAGYPAGPRRILLRTDDGAQPGLRWIDH